MTEHTDRRDLDTKRFRIDTTINLGHIITTIVLVFSVISFGSDLKAMVQKHESEIQEIKTNTRDHRMSLREELREINRKIDRIAERVGADK